MRLGHKTRAEALEELDDEMRLPMVQQMLDEVGYTVKEWHAEQSDQRLAAYFAAADEALTIAELRAYLRDRLPSYMIPAYFVRLEELPLTRQRQSRPARSARSDGKKARNRRRFYRAAESSSEIGAGRNLVADASCAARRHP